MYSQFFTLDNMEVTAFEINRQASDSVAEDRYPFREVLKEALEHVEPAPEVIQMRDARNIAIRKLILDTQYRLIQSN